eukprot:6007165-Ditylum_brightwellii.AAC.1
MLVTANLRKHYKRSDAERGKGAQSMSYSSKQAVYVQVQGLYIFKQNSGRRTRVGKWLAIVIKNKLIEIAESKFDLVGAIHEGNALTHWQEFKCAKIAQISKNLDGTDVVAPDI